VLSVDAGTFFVTVDCVVVVVVAGTGFSTTVVHEVRSTETTRTNGMKMISFFIVEVVSFKDQSAQVPEADVFRTKIFEFL
jgi:diacylglycerol kinase family enzyme